jgi:elongation factor Ts
MTEISAKQVKELRDKTGAGMMDCKKALSESNGDLTEAIEWLRKKGLASAGKKVGRLTAEGLVDSYIHTGGRIGVLVELNCETDFVARNEAFKHLVQDIAKQIAACPNVEFVRVEDIPPDVVEREKSIAMGAEALQGKPEAIKEKIVQGKLDKTLQELCLMNQPFIRDQSITVEELVKQSVSQLGENIRIRRFVRFVMGEGIEKEESNLADEVAAQTAKLAAEAAAPAPEPAPAAEPEAVAPEVEAVPAAPIPEEVAPEPEAAPAPAAPAPAAGKPKSSKGKKK